MTIALSIPPAELARMSEGQLIDAAWTIWQYEQDINAVMRRAVEDYFLYGSCAMILAPGRIEVRDWRDPRYGLPPGFPLDDLA